jgi:hypothetical protein
MLTAAQITEATASLMLASNPPPGRLRNATSPLLESESLDSSGLEPHAIGPSAASAASDSRRLIRCTAGPAGVIKFFDGA